MKNSEMQDEEGHEWRGTKVVHVIAGHERTPQRLHDKKEQAPTTQQYSFELRAQENDPWLI